MRGSFPLVAVAVVAACGSKAPPPIAFGTMGPLVGDAGKGSFRFGAASASAQVEDMDTNTDLYVWTAPAPTGLAKNPFVGDAVRGYTLAMQDIQLLGDMHLDSYRFSIEWARIEPMKGQIDETAIQHYRDELVALRAMGVSPLVTIDHFSQPIWVDDPRATDCTSGPTDTNLCGFGSPGGPQIVQAMAAHAALLAQRLGDVVDEWGTVNEPMNYLIGAYAVGQLPPGKTTLTSLATDFPPVVRDYLAAHAAMYAAIKQNDTIDADGDGVAAAVGLSVAVPLWEPARHNAPSTLADDLAARDRIDYLFNFFFTDAIVHAAFDTNLDGSFAEPHPEWANTMDWLGLQYYFRAGVTASPALFPAPASVTPCLSGVDLGACLQTPDVTWCVPSKGYEFYSDGIREILEKFAQRYPGLPLVVTESGIATTVGARRAENIVRTLESIAKARDEAGVDVRGYYHWSLTDNYEWIDGFTPRFGLYAVDLSTYARTATDGATVLGEIAQTRTMSSQQRTQYGGLGPMTPEAGAQPNAFCYAVMQ